MEQRFNKAYGSQGLKVIAIDPDNEDYVQIDKVKAFCDTLDVTYPVGVEDSEIYEAFQANYTGANPYPVDVLVDKKGIIRYVAREYDPDGMEDMIKQLLSE